MIKNIIIIILIFGFAATVVFFDVPSVQKALDFKKEIKAQNILLGEKQALLDKVDKLKGSYQTNEETFKKLEYILPNNQDVPNLIVQVEAFAVESGLSLKKIDFFASDLGGGTSRAQAIRGETGVETKEYQILTINLGLSGSYLGFKNFLKIVEENIRLMNIRTINFMPKSGVQTSDFDFEVVLEAYYYQ